MNDSAPPLMSASQMWNALALQRKWFPPHYVGLDDVDFSRPALWVANHTVYGVLDAPMLVAEIYQRHGVLLRSLADRAHFAVPAWRDMLAAGGCIVGTPENCSQLMQQGHHVLVFPGGGREVAKRKGEEHQLVWKNRTGFARMAIEHGYPIIPVAQLGADDALTITVDANDLMQTTVGDMIRDNRLLNRLTRGGDMLFPLVRGVAGLPIPRPHPFWFHIGTPIPTDLYNPDDDDDRWMLREIVAQSILDAMDQLRQLREQHQASNPAGPLRSLLQRL
jgi:1-acyl-sn-glycerol-3-phosphate acyltransferase